MTRTESSELTPKLLTGAGLLLFMLSWVWAQLDDRYADAVSIGRGLVELVAAAAVITGSIWMARSRLRRMGMGGPLYFALLLAAGASAVALTLLWIRA